MFRFVQIIVCTTIAIHGLVGLHLKLLAPSPSRRRLRRLRGVRLRDRLKEAGNEGLLAECCSPVRRRGGHRAKSLGGQGEVPCPVGELVEVAPEESVDPMIDNLRLST